MGTIMNLKELQSAWDGFGRDDPLWAILTHPDKKGRKWDEDEFFQTGEEQIESILQRAKLLSLPIKNNKALDFGCGVGRLTQPLCKHFEHVFGIDIAQSMIQKAKSYNKYGSKCVYLLNDRSDLEQFKDGDLDFIISLITLQHINPKFSRQYIKEFLRTLAPGGLLVFQLPSNQVESSPPLGHVNKG
jgi:SAM-dependent methyltransferase